MWGAGRSEPAARSQRAANHRPRPKSPGPFPALKSSSAVNPVLPAGSDVLRDVSSIKGDGRAPEREGAAVTYDLHKCKWVAPTSPSVLGVIVRRREIFYWVRVLSALASGRGAGGLPVFDDLTSRLRLGTQRIILEFPGPRLGGVCGPAGLGEWQDG